MKRAKTLADAIRLFNSLQGTRQRQIVHDLIMYFMQANEYQMATAMISLLKELDQADAIYRIIDEVDTADLLRSTIIERKNSIIELLGYIKKENFNLYSSIFSNCCIRHLASGDYKNHSSYFGFNGFEEEADRIWGDELLRMVILRVIGFGHDELNEVQHVIFGPMLSKKLISRVDPELRSITGQYLKTAAAGTIDITGYHLQMFIDMATVVYFILSRKNDNHLLFMSPNNNHFNDAVKSISTLYPKDKDDYKKAIDRIHECAVFFYCANPKQFETAIAASHWIESWKTYRTYLIDENGMKQFYNKPWFQNMNGIKEITFGN